MKTEIIERKLFYAGSREEIDKKLKYLGADYPNFGNDPELRPPYGDTSAWVLTLEKVIPEEKWWMYRRGDDSFTELDAPTHYSFSASKHYIIFRSLEENRQHKLNTILKAVKEFE